MLCGPAGLAVFICGIRLTPLEAVTDGCSLPKTQRNQALVLLVNKRSHSAKVPVLAICYYFVLSGQHIVTLITQLLLVLPLKAITSGCCLSTLQYMPNIRSIPLTITEIALIQFSLVVLKGPSICRQHAISPKEKVSGDGLESSRQGCRIETLQDANEGDLRDRPGTRGEAVCPDTCGRR